MFRRSLLSFGLVLAFVLASCGDDGDAGDNAAPTDDDAPTDKGDGDDDAPTDDDGAGDEAPEDDDRAEPPVEEAPTYDFSAISPIVEDYIEANDLNGAGLIVVHKDDGVIHHEHWGELHEDRISLIASSSKMVAAGVLMHLDDQGLLDVDAPIADAVEWGSANPDITPAQLVSNSSGLVGLNPGYTAHSCQYAPTGTLQDCGVTIFTSTDDDADTIPPDTQFRYGGGQWQVAGALAEAVSGKTWAELIDEIYVQPCELEVFGFNNPFVPLGVSFEHPEDFDGDLSLLPPVDNPNIEGGAYSTTGDYGKLLLMHLRGGTCGDTQVLSQEALDDLHSDRIGDAYGGSAGGEGTGYGMGWWVDRATGRITDPGAYGSVPWLDIEDGYGAYLVIEKTSDIGMGLAVLLFDPVEAAVTGG